MDKKTLIGMTVPKLREEALKIENITGVHSMSKDTLLEILFDLHKIPVDSNKKKRDTADLKKQLKVLQAKKEESRTAGDKKLVKVLQRRIHDLKRATR
jgi:hypothetical protein